MPSKNTPLPELPNHVARHVVGGQIHVVATLDPDGRPSTTLMTWVVALDSRRLRLCVDKRSRTFQNLAERPAIAVETLGDGITFGSKGVARIVKEKMETTPFPCAMFEMTIDEARDHANAGVSFRGPTYAYDEDKLHRHDFEKRIFSELAGR
jgi:hypothetical protein